MEQTIVITVLVVSIIVWFVAGIKEDFYVNDGAWRAMKCMEEKQNLAFCMQVLDITDPLN